MTDRIAPLIEKLEAGESITQEDIDRIARLQQLDAAARVNAILEEQLEDERRADERLQQLLAECND